MYIPKATGKLRPLGISLRLALPGGSAKIVVKRGKHVIRHVTYKRPGTKLEQIKIAAKPLRLSDYSVTVSAKLGPRTQKITLRSRRI